MITTKPREVNLMYFVFLLPQNKLLSKNKDEVKRSIFVQYKHKMTQCEAIKHAIPRTRATKTIESIGHSVLKMSGEA